MVKSSLKISSYLLIIIGLAILIPTVTAPVIHDYLNNYQINHKISEHKPYYAILKIPKINLKQELFPLDNPNNNVDKHILLLKESTLFEQNKSNIIIAGHSGSGSKAYFRNLYKLNLGDKIELYFDNNIYYYEIKEIELANKIGTLYLKENYSHMITLITCTKGDSSTQTIYYGELKKQEKM